MWVRQSSQVLSLPAPKVKTTMPSRKRSRYNQPMQVKDSGRVLGLAVSTLAFALGVATHAQNPPATPPATTTPPTSTAPPAAPAAGAQDPQRDIFRSRVDVVTTDVIVRDS